MVETYQCQAVFVSAGRLKVSFWKRARTLILCEPPLYYFLSRINDMKENLGVVTFYVTFTILELESHRLFYCRLPNTLL